MDAAFSRMDVIDTQILEIWTGESAKMGHSVRDYKEAVTLERVVQMSPRLHFSTISEQYFHNCSFNGVVLKSKCEKRQVSSPPETDSSTGRFKGKSTTTCIQFGVEYEERLSVFCCLS